MTKGDVSKARDDYRGPFIVCAEINALRSSYPFNSNATLRTT